MTVAHSLSDLIDPTVRLVSGSSDQAVKGLALDSRKVQPGFVFAALGGAARHGKDYIDQAVIDGASAILLDDGVDAALPRRCDGVAGP